MWSSTLTTPISTSRLICIPCSSIIDFNSSILCCRSVISFSQAEIWLSVLAIFSFIAVSDSSVVLFCFSLSSSSFNFLFSSSIIFMFFSSCCFSTQARSCCLMASSSFPTREVCWFTTSALVNGVTEATWELFPQETTDIHFARSSCLIAKSTASFTAYGSTSFKTLKKISKHRLSVLVLLITASKKSLVLRSVVPPDCRTKLWVVSEMIPLARHALDTGSKESLIAVTSFGRKCVIISASIINWISTRIINSPSLVLFMKQDTMIAPSSSIHDPSPFEGVAGGCRLSHAHKYVEGKEFQKKVGPNL